MIDDAYHCRRIRQVFWRLTILVPFALVGACADHAAGDVIEFLSGAKVEGKVTDIDKAKKEVTFDATIGGRVRTRTYPYSKLHAVTLGAKRYVLNPKPTTTRPPRSTNPSSGNPDEGPSGRGEPQGRSTRDIQSLIDQVGRTPPDWFDSTPLDFPQQLDLSWPKPAPKGWNNQKNVGQYVWDIINPNPNKWREGVKLMHHLLAVNKNRSDVKLRIMNELGRMYHDLHEDYARAAFWWHQAGIHNGQASFGRSGPNLASCYYKLGSKSMAMALLKKLPASYSTIKVLGDMGETRPAVQLAERYAAASGGRPDFAFMYAGDACRQAGQYQQAIAYYQRVLNVPDNKRNKRNKERGRASIEGIKYFELSDVRRVKDGSYNASAPGYTGPVHIHVVVRNGRIESVKVTRHTEKQFYSAISDTTTKIVRKQGVKGVDATSSATITSEAIINATAKALASGAK